MIVLAWLSPRSTSGTKRLYSKHEPTQYRTVALYLETAQHSTILTFYNLK